MFNYFVQIVTNRYVQATAGLLGLLIGFYSIYLTFNYSKKTDISYQLVSDSYVIEIKEKLSKLDVLYDGKSIKENGQSIRVLLFKVINSGENTIKIIDYDESAPLGYSIRHGEILELPRIYGNKGYITQKVHPKLLSTTSVAFSPIILEPNDYFNVTTLVMADDATPLTIIPNGVIAGLELGTPSFHDVTKKDVPPLYIEAFAGKWQVQAFRLPLYFFTLIFLVIAVGGVLSIPRSIAFYFEDKKNRQQRIGIDNEYILKKEKKQTPIIEYILTEYSDRIFFNRGYQNNTYQNNLESLLDLRELVEKRAELHKIIDKLPESSRAEFILNIETPYRWKRIVKVCNATENIAEQREFVEKLWKELVEFLSYLDQHDHRVGYSMRLNPSFNIFTFWLDPYKGKPEFHWVV